MENRLRQNQKERPDLAQFISLPPRPPTRDAKSVVGEDDKARSRPGTARAAQPAPSSGNMPPTPGASEGEYHLVTMADLDEAPL